MNCEEVRELIPDYFHDDMDEATRSRINRHAKTCGSCYETMEFWRFYYRVSGRILPYDAPEHFHSRVMTRIKKTRPQSRRLLLGIGLAGTVVTALLLAVFLPWYMTTTNKNQPVQPNEIALKDSSSSRLEPQESASGSLGKRIADNIREQRRKNRMKGNQPGEKREQADKPGPQISIVFSLPGRPPQTSGGRAKQLKSSVSDKKTESQRPSAPKTTKRKRLSSRRYRDDQRPPQKNKADNKKNRQRHPVFPIVKQTGGTVTKQKYDDQGRLKEFTVLLTSKQYNQLIIALKKKGTIAGMPAKEPTEKRIQLVIKVSR